jgi:hypothetical protein
MNCAIVEPAASVKQVLPLPRSCKLLFLPVFLLQAAFFYFVSQHRIIDGDEGFYLLASRLVLQHKTPYLDFFFTQAPLLPYIYALWMKLAGISWFSTRVFSALLTAVLGGVVYDHVCRETGKWIAGLAAVILFCCSSLVFAWFPIVKTFALATLFLFLSYVILVRLKPCSPGWLLALAGVFFALSVDTRSYVAGVAPVFLWWIVRADGRRFARLLWFSAGFVLGIVPSLALFFASPDAYLFNNLGYHAVRSSRGLIGDWRNKAKITWLMFSGSHTGGQFSVLSACCAAGLVLVPARRRAPALFAFLIAFVLGVICLLPTPSALQYFSMVMPFLIVAAVCSISGAFARLRSVLAVRVAGAACLVLLAIFIGFGSLSFKEYLFTGDEVPGFAGSTEAPNWTLQQVTAVSKALDQIAAPGEKVVSFWPGYIFASWADPYPGFENNFGMWTANRFSPEKRRKYHLVHDPEISAIFTGHRTRLAVVGNQGQWSGGPDYYVCVRMLEACGYTLARIVGQTSIYECCAPRR